MGREYTPIPNEWLDEMEELSDEEFGSLIRSCMLFCETGGICPPEGNGKYLWKRALNTMRRFNERWDAIAEKRREAGRQGAAARWGDSKAMANDSKGIANDSNEWQTIANDGNLNLNLNQNLNLKDKSSVFLSTRARAQERNGDLPKWASVDDVLKDEVCEIAADIYRQYVPGKELKPGICISLYTMICSVDNGKVYVDSGKVEAVRGAYERALNMGKPGNPNVIRFVLQEVSA